jgi:hypothetical protein
LRYFFSFAIAVKLNTCNHSQNLYANTTFSFPTFGKITTRLRSFLSVHTCGTFRPSAVVVCLHPPSRVSNVYPHFQGITAVFLPIPLLSVKLAPVDPNKQSAAALVQPANPVVVCYHQPLILAVYCIPMPSFFAVFSLPPIVKKWRWLAEIAFFSMGVQHFCGTLFC